MGPSGLSLLSLSGGVLVAISTLSADQWVALALLAVGAVFLCVEAVRLIVQRNNANAGRAGVEAAQDLTEHEAAACFLVTPEGQILHRNKVAREQFAGDQEQPFAAVLSDMIADPEGVIYRLQARAESDGAAREEVVTRRDSIGLSTNRTENGTFLWRIDTLTSVDDAGRGTDTRSLPMLTATRTGTILFMNEAFRRIAGGRIKTLDGIFRDLPIRSGQIHHIDGADGVFSCLVAEVAAQGGRREIYLLPGAIPASEHEAEWAGIEALPVPLLKIAPNGDVLASNGEARALLGLPLGRDARLSDLVEGLGRPLTDWLQQAVEGQGLNRPEFLRATQTTRETFVQVALNRMEEDGRTVLVAVMNDVTELKTLEAQFVQSQKMQAIGQLAGGVAHDFNNLLTAISGHCDLLLLRHDQGDPDYGDLIQINQNANRAASLVGQLLAFSRKQNLRPEVLDLRDTMSDLTHLLNRLVGEKVSLTFNHDPAPQRIRADKRQLEQVIMNLVVNARDAMPFGGEVRLETGTLVLEEPLARDRAILPAGDYVVVRVIDEGVGIPRDKLQKIFEPFFTTKRTGEGTGLGLSTAYGIVKQTSGFIFADSTVGEGTTFTLYFPVHDAIAEPKPESPERTLPPLGDSENGVVLLVEDEAPVRAFASRALRLRGYTVLEADCAEAALETLSDSELHVDIFVTDVIMPGMDGPSWVREALKTRPDTKVVFVSGYAEDAFGDDEAQIPNSVFLPKPFSLTDLTMTVHRQLF
ncbi:ATP-binding protein [Aestuariibius sp. 2305UL40-4]|uniref:hybrid sensor histidine kinase/response regulator n=1 Tax=Aestuariibius violaceus TaxID=3234132 RepID=UPI00347D7DEE